MYTKDLKNKVLCARSEIVDLRFRKVIAGDGIFKYGVKPIKNGSPGKNVSSRILPLIKLGKEGGEVGLGTSMYAVYQCSSIGRLPSASLEQKTHWR